MIVRRLVRTIRYNQLCDGNAERFDSFFAIFTTDIKVGDGANPGRQHIGSHPDPLLLELRFDLFRIFSGF